MISLIYKELSTMVTTAEKQRLYQWINESDTNREAYENIRLLWSCSMTGEQRYPDGGFEKIKKVFRYRGVKQRKRYLIILSVLTLVICLLYTVNGSGTGHFLIFENQPLSKVVQAIELTYQVTIDIENRNIQSCTFTGTFYDVDSSYLVSAIAEAMGARYAVVTHQEYKLIGGSCR